MFICTTTSGWSLPGTCAHGSSTTVIHHTLNAALFNERHFVTASTCCLTEAVFMIRDHQLRRWCVILHEWWWHWAASIFNRTPEQTPSLARGAKVTPAWVVLCWNNYTQPGGCGKSKGHSCSAECLPITIFLLFLLKGQTGQTFCSLLPIREKTEGSKIFMGHTNSLKSIGGDEQVCCSCKEIATSWNLCVYSGTLDELSLFPFLLISLTILYSSCWRPIT